MVYFGDLDAVNAVVEQEARRARWGSRHNAPRGFPRAPVVFIIQHHDFRVVLFAEKPAKVVAIYTAITVGAGQRCFVLAHFLLALTSERTEWSAVSAHSN